MSPIDLSPAEALFLIDPEFSDGRKAMKLSLRWLIAHGVLVATREMKPGTWLFRVRPRLRIAGTWSADRELPRDLADLIELMRSAPTEFFDDILPLIQWTYGASQSLPMGRKVKRNLVTRELLESRRVLTVSGLGWPIFERTPEGKDLSERLASMIEQARKIPQFIANDPERVAELAGPLDGLLLLLTELRPEWKEIANALRDFGTGTAVAYPGFDLSRLDREVLDAIDALIDGD